jgi:hypothetical protein
LAASAQKSCSNCGVIKYSYQFYDTVTQQYRDDVFPPARIWYKDSMIVEQATDSSKYVFVNLKTHDLYDYPRFSSSAQLEKKYRLDDPEVSLNGRAIYAPEKKTNNAIMTGKLADTVMDGIAYKRIASYYTEPTLGNRYDFVQYYRCDAKTSLFDLDRETSKTIGCPCVRIDVLPKAQFSVSTRIEYISNTLTDEELKTFDVWSKEKH